MSGLILSLNLQAPDYSLKLTNNKTLPAHIRTKIRLELRQICCFCAFSYLFSLYLSRVALTERANHTTNDSELARQMPSLANSRRAMRSKDVAYII